MRRICVKTINNIKNSCNKAEIIKGLKCKDRIIKNKLDMAKEFIN